MMQLPNMDSYPFIRFTSTMTFHMIHISDDLSQVWDDAARSHKRSSFLNPGGFAPCQSNVKFLDFMGPLRRATKLVNP